jgi:hypothetical protein
MRRREVAAVWLGKPRYTGGGTGVHQQRQNVGTDGPGDPDLVQFAVYRSTPPTEIPRAVSRVSAGEVILSPTVILFMSVATVKAHISRILTKLDLNNRTQIALLAHDAGLTG